MVWECQACGYIHEAEKEDNSGKISGERESSSSLPDNWVCPVCGVGPEFFEEVSGRSS